MINGYAPGSQRVFRGGGWLGEPWYARVVARYNNTPGVCGGGLGLRLVRRCL